MRGLTFSEEWIGDGGWEGGRIEGREGGVNVWYVKLIKKKIEMRF